jgi:A/G-specific adenine glycosylase
MGYNRRAIALHNCARQVMTAFGGRLPKDIDTLATLPGVGHATACSICAFAFNVPVVFLETNIRRVFIHFFFCDRISVEDREILPLVEQTLDTTNPRVWYWALMDYGSALKKTIPNPNRRSAHYTKQKKFEGSDREIRGMILKAFVHNPRQNLHTLVTNIPDEPERIKRIIDNLVKEGFLSIDRENLAIRDR